MKEAEELSEKELLEDFGRIVTAFQRSLFFLELYEEEMMETLSITRGVITAWGELQKIVSGEKAETLGRSAGSLRDLQTLFETHIEGCRKLLEAFSKFSNLKNP